ncbi:MAG: hypothetical protein J5701_07810, partial [Bacteroidales bacterium]|nr:hypothetical protein [Bacteroidales bacterium]
DVYLSLLRRLDRVTNEATLMMRALRDNRTGNFVSKAAQEAQAASAAAAYSASIAIKPCLPIS